MERECKIHGLTKHNRRSPSGWRCVICASAAVARRRRKIKEILVEESGGKCAICGYDKCLAALQFHHLDPDQKDFGVGEYSKSIDKLRVEVKKCQLLCSNCHAEIHS